MMVCQVLGSAPGVPVLSFAHNSEPLQLNPGHDAKTDQKFPFCKRSNP
jgi:hypothetical protein